MNNIDPSTNDKVIEKTVIVCFYDVEHQTERVLLCFSFKMGFKIVIHGNVIFLEVVFVRPLGIV